MDIDDINPDALWKFRVKGLGPLLVAMDSHGQSLYSVVTENAQAQRAKVLAEMGIPS